MAESKSLTYDFPAVSGQQVRSLLQALHDRPDAFPADLIYELGENDTDRGRLMKLLLDLGLVDEEGLYTPYLAAYRSGDDEARQQVLHECVAALYRPLFDEIPNARSAGRYRAPGVSAWFYEHVRPYSELAATTFQALSKLGGRTCLAQRRRGPGPGVP